MSQCDRHTTNNPIPLNHVALQISHNFILSLGNYSVTGFQLILKRKMSHYIITYYFPAGMFVIVSWIRWSVFVPSKKIFRFPVSWCVKNTILIYFLLQLSGSTRKRARQDDHPRHRLPRPRQHLQQHHQQHPQGFQISRNKLWISYCSPNKADGLTAIEMFMIVNIIFVFCALIGE